MSWPRVGYRFMPLDEEIITHFLKHKMNGNDYLVDIDVHEIDLCKHEPWDLPSFCANKESHDQTWYFFCKREKNKSYQRRLTKVGYWKSTGQDRNVKNKAGKEIGKKKTLRFHIGRTPHGKQTEWTIHEYSSSSVLPHQTHFVLCKLKKKNAGKADASGCHEESIGNPPSNNENGVIVIPEVDQERSSSPNFGDSLHPPEMQMRDLAEEEILPFIYDYLEESDGSFNNGYLIESTGLRSSGDFIENDRRLADSFLDFPDELSLSTALGNAYHENINESYEDYLQGEFLELQEASIMQDGHAVARPRQYQRKQSVAITGTLPSLKHDNVSTGVTKESFSDSTTPGDYEIYANGQEFSESSSSSSTTPKQGIHFTGQEWPGSRGYSTENRRACRRQFHYKPSNKSVPKIQKPVAVHVSQKKNSEDSGKMKRLLPESEKDQTTVVAAARSELRTSVSSFIRFETLPTRHEQNAPVVYIANVLVGLVLFVVISREMLIFH